MNPRIHLLLILLINVLFILALANVRAAEIKIDGPVGMNIVGVEKLQHMLKFTPNLDNLLNKEPIDITVKSDGVVALEIIPSGAFHVEAPSSGVYGTSETTFKVSLVLPELVYLERKSLGGWVPIEEISLRVRIVKDASLELPTIKGSNSCKVEVYFFKPGKEQGGGSCQYKQDNNSTDPNRINFDEASTEFDMQLIMSDGGEAILQELKQEHTSTTMVFRRLNNNDVSVKLLLTDKATHRTYPAEWVNVLKCVPQSSAPAIQYQSLSQGQGQSVSQSGNPVAVGNQYGEVSGYKRLIGFDGLNMNLIHDTRYLEFTRTSNQLLAREVKIKHIPELRQSRIGYRVQVTNPFEKEIVCDLVVESYFDDHWNGNQHRVYEQQQAKRFKIGKGESRSVEGSIRYVHTDTKALKRGEIIPEDLFWAQTRTYESTEKITVDNLGGVFLTNCFFVEY